MCARTSTQPPSGVNLMAFPRMFQRTWRSRAGSASIAGSTPVATTTRRFFAWKAGSNISSASRNGTVTSVRRTSRRNVPWAICDESIRSSSTVACARALRSSAPSARREASASSRPPLSIRAQPRMEVVGVRELMRYRQQKFVLQPIHRNRRDPGFLLHRQQPLVFGFDGLPIADVAKRPHQAAKLAVLAMNRRVHLLDRQLAAARPDQQELGHDAVLSDDRTTGLPRRRIPDTKDVGIESAAGVGDGLAGQPLRGAIHEHHAAVRIVSITASAVLRSAVAKSSISAMCAAAPAAAPRRRGRSRTVPRRTAPTAVSR